MRVPFLILVPVCLVLGVAAAHHEHLAWSWLDLALVVVGGLAAHIAVNALNEADDFQSGLDLHTERTPFSGGSGILPANPDLAHVASWTGWIAVAAVVLVGCWFVYQRGLALLPLVLLGLVTVVLYTRWLTRSVLLCLIAPGFGFGFVMVNGAVVALTGAWPVAAIVASLVPFFLVSNLLLLNQFPDLEADRQAGRQHLIIRHGRPAGVLVFRLFLALTYLSIALGVGLGIFGLPALLGLLTLPLAVPLAVRVGTHQDDRQALTPVLGLNVLVVQATPVLLAAGLFLA
jgi:1,4-dihydroxy-2-naphthoate octaprenyltransferase